MGFCRRCGEIVTANRCAQCGGTSKDSSTQALFSGGTPGHTSSDKWGQRYLAKSPSSSPSASSPVTSVSRPALPGRTPSRPGSPSKLASFIESAEPEAELSSVFGSVLSPKDHWGCVACQRKFGQEEVIYPHPEATKSGREDLKEVYFCRACFAERFSKGACKKCKLAVLSDAPFIKHEQNLWHDTCYICNYCPNVAGTEIIIDFAGRPSCESCFDTGAYLKKGIPPSPHLSQTGFAFDSAAVPPARSKWGRPATSAGSPWTSKAGASTKDKNQTPSAEPRSATWRLQEQRNSSPMVQSFDELNEKLRRAGLQDRPAQASPSRPTQATISPAADGKALSSGRATCATSDKPKMTSVAVLEPSLDKDTCPVCRLRLGEEGSFIQLPLTSSYGVETVLHEDCFVCGKCQEKLGQGKHVEAEGKHWHRECAPPIRLIRSVVTSLQNPDPEDVEDVSAIAELPVSDKTGCASCHKLLHLEQCVTLPRSGKTYHRSCFRCGSCKLHLVVVGSGGRSFVDIDGVAYHNTCAPKTTTPAASNPSAPAPSPLRLSSSRTLLPVVPTSSGRNSSKSMTSDPAAKPSTPTRLASSSASSSIFATRARPLPALGGLLICAGCSVRATERETVPGPKGTRFHARCLRCGSCARQLDSECRVVVDDDEDGTGGSIGNSSTGTQGSGHAVGFKLRCEACRKAEARKSYQKGGSGATMTQPMTRPLLGLRR